MELSHTECPFCGDDYMLDVVEIYREERTFLLDACCEGALADAHEWLERGVDRREVRDFFLDRAGLDVRRVFTSDEAAVRYGNSGVTLDYGLHFGPISRDDAKAFCRKHHSHLSSDGTHRPPCSWRWGHAVYNGDELVAVAMVGRPVARRIDHTKVVEVNRIAVSRDLPPELVWNACSMLYGAAVREAKARGFERVITYTRKDEAGTSLKAAGFVKIGETKDVNGWDRPSRKRTGGVTGKKDKWERIACKSRASRPQVAA